MDVRGIPDSPRSDGRVRNERADRADETRRTRSEPARDAARVEDGDDRVEARTFEAVNRSVARVRDEIDRRASEARDLREEILQRVEDPEAVRRAARRYLAWSDGADGDR